MIKRISRLLMWLIPRVKSWQTTKSLMRINHWCILRYGRFDKDHGFLENK